MLRVTACAALATLLLQPAPSKSGVLGLAHVRVATSDLKQARRFYGDLLGFPEIPWAGGGLALYRVNDRQRIIVQQAYASAESEDRLVAVGWETSDVAALQRHVAGNAIETRELGERSDIGGRTIETQDPDGHRVQFVQRVGGDWPFKDADRRISQRILHAGLTIRDAAAADRFYKDALGFGEIWRGGRPEGTINWINMRVPEGTDYLEYMLMTTKPDRRQLGTAHHIALLVPDIQAALETVRARTAADDPNHRAVPQIGVNRHWQLNVYDPDGTRVEFMEPWTAR